MKAMESKKPVTSNTNSYSTHFIADIASAFPIQLTSYTAVFLSYVYPIKY